MLQKYHSIVLKTVKYGDTKLIVDLLTREVGRTSVVANSSILTRGSTHSKNAKASRNSRQIFQPLSILDIECEQKSRNSLPLLCDAHIVTPYISLHTDMVKISVVFFLAEFLSLVSRAEQSDHLMFDFIENSLRWYDITDNATANFHLMFLVRISRFLGFYPNMETYRDGYLFDLKAAEFVPVMPLHRDVLQADDARKILTLMRMTPNNMHVYRFSHDERNRTIEILLRFYSLHIPAFRDLKSWQVLKEVFS